MKTNELTPLDIEQAKELKGLFKGINHEGIYKDSIGNYHKLPASVNTTLSLVGFLPNSDECWPVLLDIIHPIRNELANWTFGCTIYHQAFAFIYAAMADNINMTDNLAQASRQAIINLNKG